MVDKINKNGLNFAFKVLEGLIKDTAAAPDMEEAQEVNEEG
jgi:hypothetical protein